MRAEAAAEIEALIEGRKRGPKGARKVVGQLSSKDLTTRQNTSIFKALEKLLQEGTELNTARISQQIEIDGMSKEFPLGIIPHLMKLSNIAESSAGIDGAIELLKESSNKRHSLKAIEKAHEKLLQAGANAKDVAEELETIFRNIKRAGSVFLSEVGGICDRDSYTKALKETLTDIETGLTIGGTQITLPSGSINVVAAATGHGKTSFLVNMALKMLELEQHKKKSVVFYSYEEPKESMLTHFLNCFLKQKLSQSNIRTLESFYRTNSMNMFSDECNNGTFEVSERTFFEEFCHNKRLRIIGESFYAEDLCAEIEELAEVDKNLCCVFIDYFQLISLRNSSSKGSRQEELKQICLMLANTGKRAGLPIVLASQFNRKVVDESTLTYTNISEAGDIERIASLILGFWNRNFLGFGGEGNKTKSGKVITERNSSLYVEVLKGRRIGAGMNSIFPFDGNKKGIDFDQPEIYSSEEENSPNLLEGKNTNFNLRLPK